MQTKDKEHSHTSIRVRSMELMTSFSMDGIKQFMIWLN